MSESGYNKALGAVRLTATFGFIAVLVAFSRPRPVEVTVGFIIAAMGEGIRFWAAGHLLKTKELITSGPYRYTRNPLYLGRLLILTGLCIMCRLPYYANWILLVVGYLIFLGYYMPRKERIEPARLRSVHGEDYERYFKAVPALIPNFRPYAHASNLGWSSDRMFRNREAWMVIGILAITVFLLRRSHQMPPRPEVTPLATPPAAAPAPSGS